MLTIKLSFPWERYYAHPWGINPGRLREAEWPPSPWRLLRSLTSAWFRANPGQEPNAECRRLIEALARECPDIGISRVSFSQTVHWQPNYGATRVNQKRDASYKKTRLENHFVAVHGPVLFRWRRLELAKVQLGLLSTLLKEITYFGRAESLCHAVVDECGTESSDNIGWCRPHLLNNGNAQTRIISPGYRDVFCPHPSDFRFTRSLDTPVFELRARLGRRASPSRGSTAQKRHVNRRHRLDFLSNARGMAGKVGGQNAANGSKSHDHGAFGRPESSPLSLFFASMPSATPPEIHRSTCRTVS